MVGDPEYDFQNPDRPRGILTTSDRKYLLGIDDIKSKSQTERNKRGRIRRRLYHGILDFKLLFELEARDRETVFTSKGGTEGGRLAALEQGVISGLAFLYREVTDARQMDFEELLRVGILRVRFTANDQRMVHPGKVTIEIEEPQSVDLEAIAQVIQRDGVEGLTESQLRGLADFLLEQGEWSAEELGAVLRTASEQ